MKIVLIIKGPLADSERAEIYKMQESVRNGTKYKDMILTSYECISSVYSIFGSIKFTGEM